MCMRGHLGAIVLALLLALMTGCRPEPTWEKCELTGCSLEPGALWDVIADSAELEGEFDPIGAPDPYLCLTIGGIKRCSGEGPDTNTPSWNERLFRSQSVAAITGAPVQLSLLDRDPDRDDLVCYDALSITPEDLAFGGLYHECEQATVAIRFHFVRP